MTKAKLTTLNALTADEIRRFWAKVKKDGPVHPALGTPCWLFAGYTGPAGRARAVQYWIRGRFYVAPRVSWFLEHGHWPTHEACHHCDVQRCVRPDHLFDGTHAENMADAQAKARMGRGAKHPRVKVTVDQVIALRQAEHPYTLARQWGLKRATVHAIVKRLTWKWVQ